MIYNGKHAAKNNPKVDGKRLIATLEIVAFLTTAGVGVREAIKIDEQKRAARELEHKIDGISAVAESYNVNQFFSLIESKYNKYQSENWQDMTTDGLILSFFKEQIDKPELREAEKAQILYDLIQDEHLYEYIYNYIQTHSTNVTFFEESNINYEKLNTITSDEKLMHFINEASNAYQVPEPIIIGLIARSMKDEKVDRQTIMNSYYASWSNLQERRSSHNYLTGEDDRLDSWKSPQVDAQYNESNYVMKLGAIYENALKEFNGDTNKAIMATTLGLRIAKEIEGTAHNLSEKELNDVINKSTDNINSTLSYAMHYMNDGRFVIHYKGINENAYYTVTFETNEFESFLSQKINVIANDIDINLISHFGIGQTKTH